MKRGGHSRRRDALTGCRFNFAFFSSRKLWGRNTRWRSAENVGKAFAALRESGRYHVHFDDDTFGVKPLYIIDLCAQIKQQTSRTTWSGELHVNLCKERTIKVMAESGCKGVQVGIESGSIDMLRQQRKNMTIELRFESCELVKKYNIFVLTFFIVGFPTETDQTLSQTGQAM